VIRSSFDEGGNWQSKPQSVMVWDQDTAYSDMVQLSETSIGVLYEADPIGNANESIRWSTVTGWTRHARLRQWVRRARYATTRSSRINPAQFAGRGTPPVAPTISEFYS
jgi:hypothetical protein